ncbi:NAD(P)H-dependent oxidoreductase [Aurantimonas sp. Leaf443]|uniref:NADPH-dependent FMN reductase n=1 Tax=Aurantimonas sp. Leaf443 TaxID=1736378 RepID=UPI0006FB45DE|nr:NAD(P)H-dependent oxidoreductase [Aurantimonas sp. Leaf443]KQT85298.1 NADPH-dependent FMN reductase [Aurantimonas sp. Leaf443]
MTTNILVMAGSTRVGSHNRRLAAEGARLLAMTDASVSMLDLKDYPLPLYDGDIEAETGVPEHALRLAQRLAEQDGLLLVCPEYNHSIAPVLKNALDWASRVRRVNNRPLQPFKGLVVGLAAASPGRFGGARGLVAMRPVLLSLGAEVLTAQVTLADAASGFDAEGRLLDDGTRMALDALVARLVDAARSLGRHG